MLSKNATHAHQKSLYIRPEQDKKQKKVAWYKKAADMLLSANSMIHSMRKLRCSNCKLENYV